MLRFPLAAVALVASLVSSTALAQAPASGDFFIVVSDDVYNMAGGGAITQPWGSDVPISTPTNGNQLEDVCVGPNGDLFLSSFADGVVYRVSMGGDLSGATSHATGLPADAGGHLLCTATEVLATANDGSVYDVTTGGDLSAATPFASDIPGGSVSLARTGAGTLWSLSPSGMLTDITAGGDMSGATPHGTDSDFPNSGPWLGLAVLPNGDLVASRRAEVINVTAGGDLDAAPVFATVPNFGKSLETVEGLGVFVFTRLGGLGAGEVFDISAGGTFASGTGFATLPAGADLGGMAFNHGCGDDVLWTSGGETCDDGNTTDGDGCSATCVDEGAGGSGGGGAGGSATGGSSAGGSSAGGSSAGGSSAGGSSAGGSSAGGSSAGGGAAGGDGPTGSGGAGGSGPNDGDTTDDGGCTASGRPTGSTPSRPHRPWLWLAIGAAAVLHRRTRPSHN